jgi:hypothetical protein
MVINASNACGTGASSLARQSSAQSQRATPRQAPLAGLAVSEGGALGLAHALPLCAGSLDFGKRQEFWDLLESLGYGSCASNAQVPKL